MSSLIEPEVLATAKEYLTDQSEPAGYAVVDTQFSRTTWGGTTIPAEIRERLEPINSLHLRGGEPDALLAPPSPGTYRELAGAAPASPPIAVVEAKGHTQSGSQNAVRVAITQAHRHLGDVNVGYAAVPRTYVTEQDRALAREVNVGLLAVSDDGVELLETPRLVGTETSQTTETIRFHATLGDTAVENLTKNHPKNALGYAIALHSDAATADVFTDYVIKSVGDARRDAMSLGLVARRDGTEELTPLGREIVRAIVYHHGGVQPALSVISDQTSSSQRFIDACPVMGTLARQALLAYPPTQVLIDTIGEFMRHGVERPTLAQVAKRLAEERPDFALDLFVSTADRSRVLDGADGQAVDLDAFDDGTVYSTHTTFQYKAMLYHAGILTERGTDAKAELEPQTATWALETPL